MDLVPHIYHEKQERGSMLCGQHALNNLLQSGLFTAPDLAEIARGLDALEASQLGAGQHLMGDSPWESSQNYDDSGFFSVQVMENALKVWGLRLVRWGSKEMQQVHDRPELVEGFLLNHQLHWFSIRQFGNSDRFYNLDSCIPEPVWISAMYLGLSLREMERQGYSIFAVVSATDGQLGGLPPCAAAEVARTLPPPRGGGSGNGNGHSNSNWGAFSGSGHSLGGGDGSNAFASTSSASTSSRSGLGALSTTTAMNGQNGFASSARKGKRAASPDDAMGQDDDDDDDDIIIEEGKGSKSSVDSESEKRRRRRRLEQEPIGGRGTETAQGEGGGGGAAALPPGLSEEEQMAAAIAASLNVSGNGAARGEGGSGSGTSTSTATDPKVPGRAALSEEEEFRRAVAASLAEANNSGNGDGGGITESEASGDEGGEDSPTMEELRRRRLARFGAYASTSAVTLEALAALAVHVASDQTQVVLGVGAGISTAAGIPDFRGGCGSVYSASPPRSPTLAHSTNTDPRPTLTRSARRTKQLFHYDAILRPDSRAEHFQLMVELRKAAKRAVKDGKRRQQEDCAPIVEGVNSSSEPVPTAFHGLMKGLADRGRLARVYTQNIDGLEAATGLLSLATTPADTPSNRPSTPRLTRSRTSGGGRVNVTPDTPHRHQFSAPDLVVALHGSLDHVSCSVCHHTTRWKKRHTVAFKKGRAKKCPICYWRGASPPSYHRFEPSTVTTDPPTCTAQSRKLESKRAINPSQLAFLRPAIVLYDDPSFASSSAASHISSIADADLAAGPTCLIVAGTSLRIPGFRSLVKDFSKAVRQQGGFCVLVNREAVSKEWNAVFDYHCELLFNLCPTFHQPPRRLSSLLAAGAAAAETIPLTLYYTDLLLRINPTP
ncbi:hypothetical protein C6P46_003537 [Rhodotorula mucilaginosa]|uniref:Ataxin-3 homolog n=1 Tax=Rhodotorula mucilaginosa TaxID=5537 RepID=A0A9P7B7D5_RHOMI|nr:hypothetical protein C6P46_003537 [Rhodotorula mucilaginosa]